MVLTVAALDPRRLSALHQSGRHGVGDLHRLRLLERSGRERGQVHVPQFPFARQIARSSGSRCSPTRGICRHDIGRAVYAANLAGTEATAHFWFKLFPKKFRSTRRRPDDTLMEKLVTSVDPTGQLAPGPDLGRRFVKINRELRANNNQQLCRSAYEDRGEDPLERSLHALGQGGSRLRRRPQLDYQGKSISRASGFDLSDVQNAPVHAANDGKVVWASDLGIYGNCVVLDHGYALQSHLRPHAADRRESGRHGKEGPGDGHRRTDRPRRGDHVHFSMQIDGVQINPREWWDEHWIHDRILTKLNPARITPAMAAMPAPVAHARHKKR